VISFLILEALAKSLRCCPERILVEGADAAYGDGHGVAGVVLAVLEVEEVLAQFCLGDQVWS
jgi:hypothetical protein